MDTLNFLPGEPLHEQYRGRYARLKRTAGELGSFRYDDLGCLFRPVRDCLVLGKVLPNSWTEVGGFELGEALVKPKFIIEARTARRNYNPGSSTVALEVFDQSGCAGYLSFARGVEDGFVYRTGQLLLYPDYGYPVIQTVASWGISEKPGDITVMTQEGITGFDRDTFQRLHRSMHAIIPNLIDIPLQHLVLAGDWGY